MKGQVIKMNHDEMVARQVLILARQIKRRRNQHLRTVGLTTEQADALTFYGSARSHGNRV